MLATRTSVDLRLTVDDTLLRGSRDVFQAFGDAPRTALTPSAGQGLEPQSAPTKSVAATGNADVDGIISGVAWDLESITYSFPTKAGQYENPYPTGSDEPHSGFAPLTTAFKDAFQWALEGTDTTYGSYESVIDMAFGKVNGGGGVIRGAFSTDPGVAWAYYPHTSGAGGDAWFNKAYMELFDAPQPGNYTYLTVMHELGHAMGLKHGHETSGGVAGAVTTDKDSVEFTVMTYRSYVGASTTTGYVNGDWDMPQTLMMLDLAALQHMYGANYTTNAGDTVYSWSDTTGQMSVNGVAQAAPGDNRVFLTIWDGAGKDTYDLSNYAGGVNVDLAPGGWSITAEDQLAHLDFYATDTHLARANIFNAMLFEGDKRSLIENAIGGAGDDVILGNDGRNTLTGGNGKDVLTGLLGNDFLDGGLGADKLTGSKGRDTMDGGLGKDVMIGGKSPDLYVYDDLRDSTVAASDLIRDLSDEDVIDLSGIDANVTKNGDQAFTLVAAFHGKKGEAVLSYDAGTNLTKLSLDVDGDGAADAVIKIRGDHEDFTNFVL